jgi:hypothetical protein
MDPILNSLVETLIERFSQAGLPVPDAMTAKARETFVFYGLDHCAIVTLDTIGRLLEAAYQIVHKWEQIDPGVGVRQLALALAETTRCLEGEPARKQVFIICQGGLVQEVVGLAEDSYEICDCDAFDGSDEREAEQHFDALSDDLKKYLRKSGWNKNLPRSRQESRGQL